MIKVLVDTNIILDILLKRELFFKESYEMFTLLIQNKITGYISATTITDIYYISKKQIGHDKSILFLKELIDIVDVLGIDKRIIVFAINKNFIDFEDAIQISAAEMNELDCIVTRNVKDFDNTKMLVVEPKNFIKIYKDL